MISLIKKHDQSALVETELQNFPFKKLPKEIQLDVIEKLDPKRAINFEATSHASRALIANNKILWRQHGVHPPVALFGTPSTLKQAWITSRIAMLSPEARLALPNLQKPLDISSDTALQNFSVSVEKMNQAIEQAKSHARRGYPNGMEERFQTAVDYAAKAGIEAPVPLDADLMNAAYIASAKLMMEEAENYAGIWKRLSGLDLQRCLKGAADYFKKAGVKEMPLLPAHKIHPKHKPMYDECMQTLNADLKI
ncbi:MAG: F-box domain-containing protein [Hymenobacter sp.]|nr:MAG: F-box domain-containing protein [Hymenobacter sp.]